MADESLGVVLSTVDVANLLGWRVERARRWLQREGVGFQMGERWFTTPTKIRAAFPDVYQELTPKSEDPL